MRTAGAKFDKGIQRQISRTIEKMVNKFGMRETAYGVNRWNHERLVKNSVAKERKALEQKLAELDRRR
jgi:hypothetical protein